MLLPHNLPTLGKEEEDAAVRVLQSGWIAQGNEVKLFEKEFSDYFGISPENVIAVSSGSAALFLSLWVLESKGKTISYPSYVCSALRNAVNMIGGKEILIDNFPNSPNVDINILKQSIFDIHIIPHMYGIPTDLSELNSGKIVEDCCQALGAKVLNKSVGLQGDLGIFSFHATKLITSGGQGGMIISNNSELIDKIRNFRDYGPQDDKIRFNFQLTDIQAAIGREQLKKLPSFILKREEIFNYYKNSGLKLLDIDSNKKNILTPVRYRAILRNNQPQQIIKKLKNIGIRSTILIDEQGLLANNSDFKNSLELSNQTVSLPIYPTLSKENVEKIVQCVLS
jgi:perosamine synthetase